MAYSAARQVRYISSQKAILGDVDFSLALLRLLKKLVERPIPKKFW